VPPAPDVKTIVSKDVLVGGSHTLPASTLTAVLKAKLPLPSPQLSRNRKLSSLFRTKAIGLRSNTKINCVAFFNACTKKKTLNGQGWDLPLPILGKLLPRTGKAMSFLKPLMAVPPTFAYINFNRRKP
jgi:hypothetical protein